MRKRKTVKIDEREYTVKELTVKDIIEMSENSKFLGGGLKDAVEKNETNNAKADFFPLLEDVENIMARCCDFTLAELKGLAFSELREIWEAFKEVNSDFFSLLKAMGVTEALTSLRDVALDHFSKTFVTLSKQVM